MIVENDIAMQARKQVREQRKSSLEAIGRMDHDSLKVKLDAANGDFPGIVKAIIDEVGKSRELMAINHRAYKLYRLIKDKYEEHYGDLRTTDRAHFEVYEDVLLHLFGELTSAQRCQILTRDYHQSTS